jgi:signal transduction histidine kinase
MLRSECNALREPLAIALVAWAVPADRRPMTARRSVARERARPQAPDLAPIAARTIVRAVATIGIMLTVWLSVTDALELAFASVPVANLRAGLVATAITIPLHVRHLIYGVRGERPPAGAWTLAAMAIVTVAAAFLAGEVWMREFSPLAVSILIVVPGIRGFLLTGAVVLAPLLFAGPHWYVTPDHPLPGVYLAFVVVWRTTTQYVPLRLLAALRALESAGDELETRAVVQARVRIDSDVRKGVGAALQEIIARGEAARAAADADPRRAVVELQRMVSESRRALADARRLVAGYRASSVRVDLDAVTALLEASGARVRIVVADGISLDAADERARDIIRAALAEALRGEPRTSYQIQVARDGGGALTVNVAADSNAMGDL